MCLYPKLILNRKYLPNKKNGGVVPPLTDERCKYVPVGCQKCMECRKQKRNQWRTRLHEEIKHDKTGRFMTLTFNDEYLEELTHKATHEKIRTDIRKTITLQNGKKRNYYNYEEIEIPNKPTGYKLDNLIAKKAIRLFLERWRKKNGKSVKHWFTTEIGQTGTERIHIHGILFTTKPLEEIQKIWKYGYADDGRKSQYKNGYVNERSINYITKYMTKTDHKHKYYTPIICTSAGIGEKYLQRIDANNNKYNKEKTKEYYKTRQGIKLSLPIYYRNKIYSEQEREKLWIQKLNEGIRYVNGTKIDITENQDAYFNQLKVARQLNKRLGYGDDEINWKDYKYEQDMRKLKNYKRKQKLYAQKVQKMDAQ